MSNNQFSVAVIIRTLNEEKFLRQCIDTLLSQERDLIKSLDILVIDSGSNDNTVEIARSMECRLIEIPPEEFNFGGTLNLGFDSVQAELIICLSAHAIPVNKAYLNEMVRYFSENNSIAAVYSKQIPWPDADFMEKVRIDKYFPEIFINFKHVTDNLHFSNVSSCIKKAIWEKRKFMILPASEDAEWAKAVLEKKYEILYNPKAVVYHSHNESIHNKAKRHLAFLQTAMYNKKTNPFSTAFKVMYFSGSHFKQTLQTCLTNKGKFSDKLKSITKSIAESILIFFYFYIK